MSSTAFTLEEQKIICGSPNTTVNNLEFETSSRSDNVDKVFLLSINEVEKYCSVTERCCKGTPYCYSQGAKTDDKNRTCVWWLRSIGRPRKRIAYVQTDGDVDSIGYYAHVDFVSVRPALWMSLKS